MTSALELEGVTLINRGIEPAKVNHLATGLGNLGAMLHEWGRAAEAIPVLEHSIKIRRIYSDKSHEFTADLAGTLKTLAARSTRPDHSRKRSPRSPSRFPPIEP